MIKSKVHFTFKSVFEFTHITYAKNVRHSYKKLQKFPYYQVTAKEYGK